MNQRMNESVSHSTNEKEKHTREQCGANCSQRLRDGLKRKARKARGEKKKDQKEKRKRRKEKDNMTQDNNMRKKN